MLHTKTLIIPRPEADFASKVCAKPPGRDEVDPDATVFSWSVAFDDGMVIDIQVCADSEPDEHACWCQAVLYEPGKSGDLHEVSCSEVEERPYGAWEFRYDKTDYVVNVEAET